MDLNEGDLGPLQQPAKGSSEMGLRVPAGTIEAGDVQTMMTEPDRKKGEKEKKKNKKENRKERKSGGWRATLLRCFVCGGGHDGQDEWEMSAEEERLRIEERTRRAREADLQRLLKVRKVNLMHKINFKRMLRRRKMTEANEEWSVLPPRSEEEWDRKVTFQEFNACHVCFYQEEANPRLGQASGALQTKWPKKEEQLMKREYEQLMIGDMDLYEFLMVSMLCLAFVVVLFLWAILLQ
ncbi:uncharacterized protein LOC134446877 [Engraulis encrasicolus]|uniref:uncharacterized protein LOC134446877 n=1 Tax=Engraulis encrasicolus TaxID=184585 RepID=UPI002FD6DC13